MNTLVAHSPARGTSQIARRAIFCTQQTLFITSLRADESGVIAEQQLVSKDGNFYHHQYVTLPQLLCV
jgi:hypothetical protein